MPTPILFVNREAGDPAIRLGKTMEDPDVNHLKSTAVTAITLLIALFVTQSAVNAHAGNDLKNNARHSRIVGLYDVDVVVGDCSTGAALASFRALHKYEQGGTGQVVPATSPVGLSEHSMIWSHVHGNDYRNVVKTFRFDAAGNNIGWIVIRNEISISGDAISYSGYGIAEIYNAAGNLVATSCPSFTGTRFTGE